jgi:tetratricopeptide (TPR) repeat protein
MASAIQQAVALHRQGQLGEAERLYTAVLAAEPSHFDALHLLGVLMHQRGRSADALDLIAKALAANDRSADARANFGRVLGALKRNDEAVTSFDKALALKPDHAEALFHRGNALVALQRPDEALANYDAMLAVVPNYVQAHINRGVTLRMLKRLDEAVASYDRALAINPTAAEAHVNRGNALLDLKRPAEALPCYDNALAIQSRNVEAIYNRGNALLALKRPADALASYDGALALAPDHASALVNRGMALRELKRPAEALSSIDRALEIGPSERAEANNARGTALSDLDRLEEALGCFDAALRIRPDYTEAEINRGNILMDLRRTGEALASCEAVLVREPDNADAHWNRGLIRLAQGDFARGWPDYEWRAKKKEDNDVRRFAGQRWTGKESLQGKTILLHAEQGFGDTIQFIRYAPLVAAKGARVIVEVPTPLKELVAAVEGVSGVTARGEPAPSYDLHCPLMSLPLAFGTTLKTVPADVPYLHAPADRIAAWRERLPDKPFRVGIAWTGNPTHRNDRHRSTALEAIADLSSDPRMQFIGIQKDVREDDALVLRGHPHVLSLGPQLRDFSDTAAVISLLDLVISVDTSVAHLAGALGKPLWLMLPYNGDWRWMLEGETSPWYPTARLFRQPKVGDWDSVLARVRNELAVRLNQR